MKLTLNIEEKSENVSQIQAMFGIDSNQDRTIVFPDSLSKIRNSNLTYITGPSGSGKSLLGQYLIRELGYTNNKLIFDKDIPIIDALDCSLKKSLFYLNMVGLSEAFLYLTSYSNLSEGQKFRFELAYILSQEEDYIVIDEFCSLLDRETAHLISYNLQKIIRRFNKHLVLISAHEDICESLSPDLVIEFNDYGVSTLSSYQNKNRKLLIQDYEVKSGTYAEFQALEKYHYFGDVSKKTLDIRNAEYYSLFKKNKLMGILVTTSPYVLNDKESNGDLGEINKNIRLIFRVILHPKVRGIGATKILFREVLKKEKTILYLRSALAKRYPFPQKLGMTQMYYDDFLSFQEFNRLQNFKLSSIQDTFEYGRYILAKMMHRDYKRYLEILNKEREVSKSILYFYNVVKTIFPNIEDLELIEDVIKPVEMEDYYIDNR